MNILGYLERELLEDINTDEGSLATWTVIHLCSAHIMHRLSLNLTKTFWNGIDFKQLMLHVFVGFLRGIAMTKIGLLFTLLFNVLSNEYSNGIVSFSWVELIAYWPVRYNYSKKTWEI